MSVRAKKSPAAKVSHPSIWGLGGMSPWQVIKLTATRYGRLHLNAHCTQFAYYALFAIGPLLIVILWAISKLPMEGVLDSFLAAIDHAVPDHIEALLRRQIQEVQAHSSLGLLGIGLFLLAIMGSRVFLALGAGLDAAYGIEHEHRRRYWKQRGLALALTIGAFLMLLVSMMLLVVGPLVTNYLTTTLHLEGTQVWLYSGIRWTVACVFMLLATSLLYWLVPSMKLPYRLLSPGTVFATFGWVALTQGMRLFVENFGRFNETYGAIAGVIVLLAWLHLTGTILLTGGLLNGVIDQAVHKK